MNLYPLPDSLPHLVDTRTRQALDRGALTPLSTRCRSLEQEGIPFTVRILEALRRKASDGARRGPDFNPFLPYDPDLFVVDLSDRHVALLNKFNVIQRHLLIVTRDFREQREPLDRDDFTVLAHCLADWDGLAFYNAGEAAGASQRHKHLQLIPRVLDAGASGIPLEPVFREAMDDTGVAGSPRLPFAHGLMRLDAQAFREPREAGERLHRAYLHLGRALEVPLRDAPTPPYNLLATRDWLLLVPRTRECFETLSINALAFAGALLVRDEEQFQRLARVGPLQVLAAVARPGQGVP